MYAPFRWLAEYDEAVPLSLAGAAAGLMVWCFVLLWSKTPREGRFRVRANIKSQHYIQASCQFGIYLYWSLYWPEVGRYAPLIACQLVFAYLFEMLVCWSKNKVWPVGFGPFPIVFSINFFMWFRPPFPCVSNRCASA